MLSSRRVSRALLIFALLVGCAKAPPTLSPAGAAAWQGIQAIRILDTIRDVAISAEAQSPKVLSTETTRKVVTWHKAALQTIQATPGGWKLTVLAGLDALYQPLTPSEQAVLRPYIFAAKLAIESVQ